MCDVCCALIDVRCSRRLFVVVCCCVRVVDVCLMCVVGLWFGTCCLMCVSRCLVFWCVLFVVFVWCVMVGVCLLLLVVRRLSFVGV